MQGASRFAVFSTPIGSLSMQFCMFVLGLPHAMLLNATHFCRFAMQSLIKVCSNFNAFQCTSVQFSISTNSWTLTTNCYTLLSTKIHPYCISHSHPTTENVMTFAWVPRDVVVEWESCFQQADKSSIKTHRNKQHHFFFDLSNQELNLGPYTCLPVSICSHTQELTPYKLLNMSLISLNFTHLPFLSWSHSSAH